MYDTYTCVRIYGVSGCEYGFQALETEELIVERILIYCNTVHYHS
jgi:hypothetical protein